MAAEMCDLSSQSNRKTRENNIVANRKISEVISLVAIKRHVVEHGRKI